MKEVEFLADCQRKLATGEAAQAVLALQDFLVQHPENESGWRLLAEGVARLGDPQLATQTLDHAARQLGSPALARDARARWERLGQPRRGRDLLRHFVIHECGDLALYRELAQADLAENRIADAHAALEKALAISPNDETLFGDYVGLAVLLGKPGRSLSHWSRFTDKSRDATVLINMAVLFLRSGDLDFARRLLARVGQRDHPMLHFNLAEIALRRGRFSEAADAYLRAHRLGKSVPEMICLALLFASRDAEALSWLPSLPPSSVEVMRCLLEDGRGLRASLLPSSRLAKEAWLEEMRRWQKRQGGPAACLAQLHLLRAWRFLQPPEPLPPLDFLCASFPAASFIELVCSARLDLLSSLELFFDCFNIEARAQRRHASDLDQIFATYFLPAAPALLQHAQRGRVALLLRWSYPYLKAAPTPERFIEWSNRLADTLAPWRLPAMPRQVPPAFPAPLRIGYIVEHFMHDEAPDHTLLGLTAALRRHGGALPIVFAFNGASETIMARGAETGVEFIACPFQNEEDFATRQSWLVAELRRRAIDLVVFYGTNPAFCVLLAPSLPVATVLYESVAHAGFQLPGVDGHLRSTHPCGASAQTINGAEWWFYQNSIPAHTPSTRQGEDARLIRTRFGDRPVLGCIARAAKLTDEFLDTVAAILTARPSALFVWTDFLPDPHVLAKLKQRGIDRQCHYAGYVDYVVWAEVLDVHLDPFPFASGLTMRQTWHRGRAYVMMGSRYRDLDGREKANALSLFECSVGPLLALGAAHPAHQHAVDIFGEDLRHLAVADSVQAYIDWAIRLIDDEALRTAVGTAAKAYSDAFLTNMSEVAETYLAGLCHFWRKKHR